MATKQSLGSQVFLTLPVNTLWSPSIDLSVKKCDYIAFFKVIFMVFIITYAKYVNQNKNFVRKCLFWLANRNFPAGKEILAELAGKFRIKLQSYLSKFLSSNEV